MNARLRRARAIVTVLVASGLLSCSQTPVAPAAPKAQASPAPDASDGREPGWGDDLANLVPREADYVLGLAGIDEFEKRFPPEFMSPS